MVQFDFWLIQVDCLSKSIIDLSWLLIKVNCWSKSNVHYPCPKWNPNLNVFDLVQSAFVLQRWTFKVLLDDDNSCFYIYLKDLYPPGQKITKNIVLKLHLWTKGHFEIIKLTYFLFLKLHKACDELENGFIAHANMIFNAAMCLACIFHVFTYVPNVWYTWNTRENM